MDYRTS